MEIPEPLDVEIGRRLKEVREAEGMTQKDVAKLLGVSFQQVQKYENGKNRMSVSSLVRFCWGAGLDAQEVVEFVAGKAERSVEDGISNRERHGILKAYGEVCDPKRRRIVLQLLKELKG